MPAVKLKLDENLSRECERILVAAGHDVATVPGQAMSAAVDADVIEACRREGRALITLDLDFSNPLVFQPERYAGIAVLRLPAKVTHEALVATVQTLVGALDREPIAKKLWSVEVGRIRIYQPPDDPNR